MNIRHLLVVAVSLVVAPPTFAEIHLPAIFGDHMVLQREMDIPVWGTASPGANVSVALGEQRVVTTAGEDGRWRVELAPLPAGGPHEMVVEGDGSRHAFSDILIGEVWLASGQSNMEWSMRLVENAEAEVTAANHPDIRLFHVARAARDEPQDDVSGQWQATTPESVYRFSGVAYYFGRKLHEELDVPVGRHARQRVDQPGKTGDARGGTGDLRPL